MLLPHEHCEGRALSLHVQPWVGGGLCWRKVLCLVQGQMGPWVAASRDLTTALRAWMSGLEAGPWKCTLGLVLMPWTVGEGEPALGAHTAGRGAELRASYSGSFRNTRTPCRVLPASTPVRVKHTLKGLREEPGRVPAPLARAREVLQPQDPVLRSPEASPQGWGWFFVTRSHFQFCHIMSSLLYGTLIFLKIKLSFIYLFIYL